MAGNPTVEVRGLARRYGRREVLTAVDLDVHAGQVLGFIGPNGGGKSTLLLLLAGLVRPSAGTVRMGGIDTTALARRQTGEIGLITATPGLYPLLTGWENLDFFGGLFGLGPARVRERATPLLAALDLLPHMEGRTGAWSSGMQQKLSLARARLTRPGLLLLDEPTANLDPISADTLWREVRRAADEGLAVVLVTHDLVAAEAIADRIGVVEGGVRHVETLGGARSAPPTGRLLGLYRAHVEGR